MHSRGQTLQVAESHQIGLMQSLVCVAICALEDLGCENAGLSVTWTVSMT